MLSGCWKKDRNDAGQPQKETSLAAPRGVGCGGDCFSDGCGGGVFFRKRAGESIDSAGGGAAIGSADRRPGGIADYFDPLAFLAGHVERAGSSWTGTGGNRAAVLCRGSASGFANRFVLGAEGLAGRAGGEAAADSYPGGKRRRDECAESAAAAFGEA